MLRLGLPHVNILSKVDLLSLYGALPFNLDFYTEMLDLTPLARYVGHNFKEYSVDDFGSDDDGMAELKEGANEHRRDSKPKDCKVAFESCRSRGLQRFQKMTSDLCEVLSDFGMISFLPLNIEDRETMQRVLQAIDKANGYSFAASEVQEINRRAAEQQSGLVDQAKINHLFRVCAQDADCEYTYNRTLEIQERYSSDS